MKGDLGHLEGLRDLGDRPALAELPAEGELPIDGLEIPESDLREVLTVDVQALRTEIPQLRDHLAGFGDLMPTELGDHLHRLE